MLLNQAYTFPGNASGCHHAEWRKRPPIDTTITTYKNHVCTTGKGFKEDLICKDKHLLLKSAKYTDQGPYEFLCDGDNTAVNLDVLCKSLLYLIQTLPVKSLEQLSFFIYIFYVFVCGSHDIYSRIP